MWLTAQIVRLSFVALLVGCLSLSACSHGPSTPLASPTATGGGGSTSGSDRAEHQTETPATLPLALPYFANGELKQPKGDANKTFGEDFVMNAYRFAVAFAYQATVWPEMWDPERPPSRAVLASLSAFLAEDARSKWEATIPLVLAGERKGAYKDDVMPFNSVYRPWRYPEGAIEIAKNGVAPTTPLALSQTIGEANAWTCTLNGSDRVCLNFIMIINMAFGKPGKPAEYQANVTRQYRMIIGDNPDEEVREEYPLSVYFTTMEKGSYGELQTLLLSE